MSTAEQRLTAELYFETPDPYESSELVRGVAVRRELPGMRHGFVCGQLCFLLAQYLESHNVGRACCGGGIITQRDPDTVRGADVFFYSDQRLPRELMPVGYPACSPNIVFEVNSPNDRWSETHEKIAEYLTASVELVCVLVPEDGTAHLFYPDRPGVILHGNDELTLPAPLDGFRQPVSAFFAVS